MERRRVTLRGGSARHCVEEARSPTFQRQGGRNGLQGLMSFLLPGVTERRLRNSLLAARAALSAVVLSLDLLPGDHSKASRGQPLTAQGGDLDSLIAPGDREIFWVPLLV